MKQRTLYIPGHVTTENVVWQGLLVRDAVKVIILTVIAAVIALLIGMVFSINQLYLILAVVIAAACSVGVLQRFETNLSMAVLHPRDAEIYQGAKTLLLCLSEVSRFSPGFLLF